MHQTMRSLNGPIFGQQAIIAPIVDAHREIWGRDWPKVVHAIGATIMIDSRSQDSQIPENERQFVTTIAMRIPLPPTASTTSEIDSLIFGFDLFGLTPFLHGLASYFELVRRRRISDIDPKPQPTALPVEMVAADLNRYVEPPVRKAVRILIEKGITTLSSSANRRNIADPSYPYPGHAYIAIEHPSDENRAILQHIASHPDEYGVYIPDFDATETAGEKYILIGVPVSLNPRIAEVEQRFTRIAQELKPQQPGKTSNPVSPASSAESKPIGPIAHWDIDDYSRDRRKLGLEPRFEQDYQRDLDERARFRELTKKKADGPILHIDSEANNPQNTSTGWWVDFWRERGPLNGGNQILREFPREALGDFLGMHYAAVRGMSPQDWKNATHDQVYEQGQSNNVTLSRYWKEARKLRMPGATPDESLLNTTLTIAWAELNSLLIWTFSLARPWFPAGYNYFIDFRTQTRSPHALIEKIVWLGSVTMFEAFFVLNDYKGGVHFITRFAVEPHLENNRFIPGRILVGPYYGEDSLLIPLERIVLYGNNRTRIESMIQAMFDRYPEEMRLALDTQTQQDHRSIKSKIDSETGNPLDLFELKTAVHGDANVEVSAGQAKRLIIDPSKYRFPSGDSPALLRSTIRLPNDIYEAMKDLRHQLSLSLRVLMTGLVDNFLSDTELQNQVVHGKEFVDKSPSEANVHTVIFQIPKTLWKALDLRRPALPLATFNKILKRLIERWIQDNSDNSHAVAEAA